jgi:hypothetical protein
MPDSSAGYERTASCRGARGVTQREQASRPSASTFDPRAGAAHRADTGPPAVPCRYGGCLPLRERGYALAVGTRASTEYDAPIARRRSRPGPLAHGRIASGARTSYPDALADPLYEHKQAARIGEMRTMLGVPLPGRNAMGASRRAGASRPLLTNRFLVIIFADQAASARMHACSELQAHSRPCPARRGTECLAKSVRRPVDA